MNSLVYIDEQDLRTFIMQNLTQPSSSMAAKELKDFTLINGKLCFRGSSGVVARAMFKAEAKETAYL